MTSLSNMRARHLLTATRLTGNTKGNPIMNDKKETTVYTVNLYNTDKEIIESYEYRSLEEATTHMENIENAPHLYPGITTELKYD